MIPSPLEQSLLELPETERIALARKLVESLGSDESSANLVEEGVQRIDDVASGRTPGLSEAAFRQALK